MTDNSDFDNEEQLPLKDFTEKAYLEYSMYVILDRALPHIGDGLKPVQRRIVYAMSELGLKATAKYKKSARTVGDVLGKFHPHGDTACYEAMVLMAQPFSYRYPLVDGQGNWGSPDDPKSFAAMRYTESRLSKYAEVLLDEVGKGTVTWTQNFDGTLEEPAILPARLPNLLLNGTMGIAVGMSTDIPPHNLCEVADAAISLLDSPKQSTRDLFQFIKGPDYPTEAEIITPRESIMKTYESGTGSVKMRAVYEEENGDIVINALPYQVSGAKILEQIAAQMQAKKLPMVADLRDESDHDDPTRFVIVPKSNRVDKESLMAHLFATTDLEKSYRINMNVIGLNGKPQVKGFAEMLGEWLTFRTETVRKRLQHRLEKVLSRLHILDGLMIAYLNIDEVIQIIRTEDKPKPVLMERFKLTDTQAEAILELKLRHLARLEEQKISGEQDELSKERKSLETTLKSEKRLKTLIKKEIRGDVKKFGDERKSPVVERSESHAMSQAEIIPIEPVTVILSKGGWVRAAKGHDVDPEKIKFKAGDELLALASGRSNQNAVFLDTTGRSYSIAAHTLPSARGQGEPLTGRLNLPTGAKFNTVIMGQPDDHVLLSNDAGYGFITQISQMQTKNRAGKVTLNLPENSQILPPVYLDEVEKQKVIAVTNEGRLLIFPAGDLPQLARGKGNKIIDIPARRAKTRLELLKRIMVMPVDAHVIIHAGLRHFTLSGNNMDLFCGTRGRRGKKLPRGFQNVTEIKIVTPEKPEE